MSDQLLEPHRATSPAGSGKRSKSIDSNETLLPEGNKHPENRSISPTPSNPRKAGDSLVTIAGLPGRSKSPRPDRASDPSGFTLLHCPEGRPVADIIFIHGLGGSSRLSWSKNKDLALFWPLQWLPADPDMHQARIFTFGYDAFFLSPQSTTLGISDFAKNLLYDLLYGRDSHGQDLRFGQVCYISPEYLPCSWYVQVITNLSVRLSLGANRVCNTFHGWSRVQEGHCSLPFAG